MTLLNLGPPPLCPLVSQLLTLSSLALVFPIQILGSKLGNAWTLSSQVQGLFLLQGGDLPMMTFLLEYIQALGHPDLVQYDH